jgi:hypothetical protein
MSYKTVGKRARKWAEDFPHLAVAAVNLRAQAGMSENAIYHQMRKVLITPKVARERVEAAAKAGRPIPPPRVTAPSIRQIRAAWEKYDAEHLTLGGRKGQRFGVPAVKGERHSFGEFEQMEGHSRYREKRKAQFSQIQMDLLDMKTVVGYLNQAQAPQDDWADPDSYLLWEETHSYDYTPPF